MFRNIPFNRVNWFTSSFLIITFFVALIGTPLYIINFGLDPFFIVMFLLYFAASAMGITMGYHRLFAHRAFKASVPVRLTTLIFGACAFEDSALDWASDHRNHHKHTDHEEDDPYAISKGFLWAHIGWIFFKLYPRELNNVSDLRKDKLVMWQHKYHYIIGIVVGILLPTLLGYWYAGPGGAWGGFLFGGITRVVLVQHCTFLINSLCHTMGRQPYCSQGSARDSFLMAIFTFGEGYHNYHHTFQHDYRNGVKPWQWDPTKWAIWTLSKLGLVEDLRQVAPEKIVLAELRETRRKAEERLRLIDEKKAQGDLRDCPVLESAIDHLRSLVHSLQECYDDIEESFSKRLSVSRYVLERSRLNASQVLKQLIAVDNLQPMAA
ncbi:MAG: fatty acid desaturase [Verrucomicrobiales bacterium]|nr:fatty acid desaturase [Verrucomicrobiales bacterium]